MDRTTFFVYLAMYLYGFGLMIWAIFFDKRPTKKSYYGSIIGIILLSVTLLYFVYVLFTFGVN